MNYCKQKVYENYLHCYATISSLDEYNNTYQNPPRVMDMCETAAMRKEKLFSLGLINAVHRLSGANIPMILLSIVTVIFMAFFDRNNLIWALSLASFAEALENNGPENKREAIRAVTFDVLLHNGLVDNFDLLDTLGNSEVTMTVVITQMSLYIILMDISLLLGCTGKKRYATARTGVAVLTTIPFLIAPLAAIFDGLMSGRATLIAFVSTEIVLGFTDIEVEIGYSIAIHSFAWVIRLLKLHFYFRFERLAVHNAYWVPAMPFIFSRQEMPSPGSARWKDEKLIKVMRAIPVDMEEFILRKEMCLSQKCCEPLGTKKIHRSISTSLNGYGHLAVGVEQTDDTGAGLTDINYKKGAILEAIAKGLDFRGRNRKRPRRKT